MRGEWEGAIEPAALPLSPCLGAELFPENPAGQGSGKAGEPGWVSWGSSGVKAASALFAGPVPVCV